MRSKICAFLLLISAFPSTGRAQQPAQNGGQRGQAERDLRFEGTPANAPSADALKIPRGYAVVIGVSKYQHLTDAQQLLFAERDAESIYSVLISPEGGNFRAENVHKLIGSKATLANIRQELEQWLPSVAREEDRVLVYFAGHGFVSEDSPYLSPFDLDPANISKTGYAMSALSSVFGSKIKARWKVLLTDACHSGAINPDAVQTINRSLITLNQSLFSLTASRDREQSFESPDWGGGHGIFTYYVVRGLEGAADENKDAIITADELAEYVRRNVREASSGRQNPTSERASFDPNMLLAYVPSNRGPDAPPPPKFGTFIVESNMDGVELFVDGKSAGIVDKGKPLRLPGLTAGVHTIQGVKMGYEPDGPREEVVYPGQESTVSIKILIARRRNRAAVDSFEKGLEYYNKSYEENYRKAVEQFQKALDLDPKYSQATLYLARTYNALFDQSKAREYFQKSIDTDPDFMEARSSFGGMLLDIGDVDTAIRQLNIVVQRDSKQSQAYYLLAQAFRMKEAYKESIDAARHAIALAPANAEAHFWLAESLRMSKSYEEAKKEYLEYLRLSDFDSKLAGKLNYYVAGFLIGKGKKKRAAQHDIWEDLRGLAYFGLCDSERLLSRFDSAIGYCQKSLSYDGRDPYTHYAIALAYARQAEKSGSIETLAAALKHFNAVTEINSDLVEAGYAKKNAASIEGVLSAKDR
jgi:tetratricopeptide (TPR) repeat protein